MTTASSEASPAATRASTPVREKGAVMQIVSDIARLPSSVHLRCREAARRRSCASVLVDDRRVSRDEGREHLARERDVRHAERDRRADLRRREVEPDQRRELGEREARGPGRAHEERVRARREGRQQERPADGAGDGEPFPVEGARQGTRRRRRGRRGRDDGRQAESGDVVPDDGAFGRPQLHPARELVASDLEGSTTAGHRLACDSKRHDVSFSACAEGGGGDCGACYPGPGRAPGYSSTTIGVPSSFSPRMRRATSSAGVTLFVEAAASTPIAAARRYTNAPRNPSPKAFTCSAISVSIAKASTLRAAPTPRSTGTGPICGSAA